MSDWPTIQIKDITTKVGSGSTPRGGESAYQESGIPLIRSLNVHLDGFRYDGLAFLNDAQADELRSVEVRAQDVLLNITGASIGRVTQAPADMDGARVSQHVCIIRPKEPLQPAFLRWFLASPSQQALINREQTGATRQGLTKEKILNFEVPIPSQAEQRRIVAKIEELFSDLDAGVAALRRAKANLKRYRAAVLKAAVEGDLTAEWRAQHPDTEPASQLLTRILKQRRDQWEATQLTKFQASGKEPPKNWRDKYVEPAPPDTNGLPELPQGWCWATIQQLGFVDVGFAFKSAEYTKDGVRLLRGENMEPGSLRWNDVRYWPVEKLEGLEHLLVQEGQIILAMDRPLVSAGLKLARAKASDIPCLLVQRMARLRLMDDGVTGFLHCSMQTQAFISHVLGDQTGTQLPHISGSGIEGFVTPLPPLDEQQQIATEISERLSQIEAAEAAIERDLQRAARLRQSILQQAFTGQLVPQDPTDEPARTLLERIRSGPPAPVAKLSEKSRKRKT